VFAIVTETIDPAKLEAAVRSEGSGAVAVFLGIVRSRSDDGRLVTGLFYEASEAAAIAEFRAIAREARERFGECDLAIVHRVGNLPVGEVAVAVCVATPHRAQAFDACEYAIDQLKQRAPIWKKEAYVDGGAQWKDNSRAEDLP